MSFRPSLERLDDRIMPDAGGLMVLPTLPPNFVYVNGTNGVGQPVIGIVWQGGVPINNDLVAQVTAWNQAELLWGGPMITIGLPTGFAPAPPLLPGIGSPGIVVPPSP